RPEGGTTRAGAHRSPLQMNSPTVSLQQPREDVRDGLPIVLKQGELSVEGGAAAPERIEIAQDQKPEGTEATDQVGDGVGSDHLLLGHLTHSPSHAFSPP